MKSRDDNAIERNRERVHAPLEKTVRTLADPFRDFVRAQSASGWVLLSATALAVVLANSKWGTEYFTLLHLPLTIDLAGERLAMSLQHWVNDGLMALFFFLLSLELKRELLVGRLSELRRASSVLCAAIGGISLPALLFLVFADSAEIRSGWAIPVATDTAFALMVLVLLGERIPASARAFLVGLAIVDDIGAILVIAIAYTTDFDPTLWLPVLLTFGSLIVMNAVGARSGWAYLVVGALLWVLFLRLGLHGTLAGVVVALTAPVRPELPRSAFIRRMKDKLRAFEKQYDRHTSTILEQPGQQAIAHEVGKVAVAATAPLNRWEALLEKPISFAVMPLFAFMNAGVVMHGSALADAWHSALSTAIFIGLLVGKPLGIILGVWLGSLARVAELPKQLTWRHLFGIGTLGGIGFTMSLFISTLSFAENAALLEIAKQSILITSLCAGILGYVWLRWVCEKPDPDNQ